MKELMSKRASKVLLWETLVFMLDGDGAIKQKQKEAKSLKSTAVH